MNADLRCFNTILDCIFYVVWCKTEAASHEFGAMRTNTRQSGGLCGHLAQSTKRPCRIQIKPGTDACKAHRKAQQ